MKISPIVFLALLAGFIIESATIIAWDLYGAPRVDENIRAARTISITTSAHATTTKIKHL